MYNKVILVCYTGQTTSYSAAILQLLGYNNIYVLEWGMCGWNKKFSEKLMNKSIHRRKSIKNMMSKINEIS